MILLKKKLYMIQEILEHLGAFRHLINRHNETRLNKYNKKKSESKGVPISELQRLAPVMEYFNASLSVLELTKKFEKLYYDIEKKKLQSRYRKANRPSLTEGRFFCYTVLELFI